ncbi:MAG TPA: hypothetical protein VMZ31_04025 [Phycisphaerae bacterium]|nr:hypothetical protein [Phycisphaerae bacterium]
MDCLANDQVVFVLKVFVNVAPVAVYFLVLGLLNSQPRPHMVNGRSDFVALTLVFVPMLVWPVPVLLQHGLWPLLLAGLLAAVLAFGVLLPGKWTGWVIYNVTERRCRRHLENALTVCGLTYEATDGAYVVASGHIRIRLASFALLQNVSVYFEFPEKRPPTELLHRLRGALEAELRGLALLPSSSGACMLALGILLLILPLWMINNHVDAIVETITRLLFA